MFGPDTLFARSFRPHAITKLLEGSQVVFPLARSVGAVTPAPAGWTDTVLVETSPDGWGETDLRNLETKMAKDDKDVKGPVPLAVAVDGAPPPAGAAAGGKGRRRRARGREEGPDRRLRRRRLRDERRGRERGEPLPPLGRRQLGPRARVARRDPAEVGGPGGRDARARRRRADRVRRPPRSSRPRRSPSGSRSGSAGGADPMSTRKLLLLTAVFLGLLAFVVLFERHQPTSEERAKAARRLLDFRAEDVTAVQVERPDLPKVELKKSRRTVDARRGARGRGRTPSPRTASSPTSGGWSWSATSRPRSTRRSTASTGRRRRSRSRSRKGRNGPSRSGRRSRGRMAPRPWKGAGSAR